MCKRYIVLSLSIVVVVGCFAHAEEKVSPLIGTWSMQSYTIDGRSIADVKGSTITFSRDWLETLKNCEKVPERNAYVLDNTQSPKRMTVYQSEQRDVVGSRGIYEIKGNTLRICMANPALESFPSRFDAPGCMVIVLTRAAAKD